MSIVQKLNTRNSLYTAFYSKWLARVKQIAQKTSVIGKIRSFHAGLDTPSHSVHILKTTDMPKARDKRTESSDKDQYRVGTLEKGLKVMELLERGPLSMSIQEIAAASGIQRNAVFRLLCTLEERGYVERLDNKKYRLTTRRRRAMIGYCAPLKGTSFRVDVAESIHKAAEQAGVDVLVVDNREEDLETSLTNGQLLIDAKVDVAISFQPIETIVHAVADSFAHARIPFISIEQPIPGAVYFGANNFRAGKLAGEVLGKFALENWAGQFDRIVLLESSTASSAVRARLAGVLLGIRETVGRMDESRVIHLDGRGHMDSSRVVMEGLLRELKRGTRMLISGFNDLTALGALQALRADDREQDAAIVGHNAAEGREEIRNPASRLIASIAYFPERYGEKLIRLALSLLSGEQVPPAVYTEHVILDRHNIDKYYSGEPRLVAE